MNKVLWAVVQPLRGPITKAKCGRKWASAPAERAHAVLHLGGNPIVADHRARIAQPDRLALDDEAPQGVACVLHKLGASDAGRSGAWAVAMGGQCRERRLER